MAYRKPMSFPLEDAVVADDTCRPACVEVFPAHESQVGDLTVRRSLPTRGRRMVGAWCFADHMGPARVAGPGGVNVGPHPHMGLQTVTWLLDGEILHRDSLGSEQIIRPGQLNLMSAGRGVSHSEESTHVYEGTLEGIQLWLAQTDDTRWDEPTFRHHADLPTVELTNGAATVLVGSFAGVTSPEAQYGDEVAGVNLVLRGDQEIPLNTNHEYGVVVMRGQVRLGQTNAEPGSLYYLGRGRASLDLTVNDTATVVLLGGVPFERDVLMWWNFVGRSWDEMSAASSEWNEHGERFGAVASDLERHTAPMPLRR